MVEARSIETLSLTFTAGVIAGTMLPGAHPVLPLCLLSLLLFPFLLGLPRPRPAVLAAVFLLLGVFCSWNNLLPGISGTSLVRSWAEEAVTALRRHIGSLPFASEETAPLLQALLTGDRSSLPESTRVAFRESGASHLLALSGLHMGIIYLIFDYLTRPLGRSPLARKLRFALLVSASAFYTLMTGAGASVVRAFLFITINETLQLLRRPRKASRVLCLALLVQLVLDPGAIRGIGFQLSYLAMAGIFLLYPVLESWYPSSGKWDPMRKIWCLSALSISCQVFTAPLAWIRFHTFPRYFLLTNLMAIPLTTTLMATAVATVVLSAMGLCPAFLVAATDSLCRLLVWVLETIAGM